MEDGRRWNEGLVCQLFLRESTDAIVKLRVREEGVANRLFWPIDSSGDFTVKFVHKTLVSHRVNSVTPFRPAQWQDLWKLKVHDHLKLLLWKVI